MANRKCLIVFLFYGPGDAIARVSRSSMVALHTLLSCVLKCQMQFTAIVPGHVDPSFLLSSPLPGSMYLAVVCYLMVSAASIRFRCPKYRSRLFRIMSIIPIGRRLGAKFGGTETKISLTKTFQ